MSPELGADTTNSRGKAVTETSVLYCRRTYAFMASISGGTSKSLCLSMSAIPCMYLVYRF